MRATAAYRKLTAFLDRETSEPVPRPADYWVERLRAMPGAVAVLFYGSGLRKHTPDSQVVYDFYLLVHRYRDFASGWRMAVAGTLVPPNVYYFEEQVGEEWLRCKVAVLTVSQFCSEADSKAFTPHIWARFCQPCRIPFAEDATLRSRLVEALASCVLTFHRHTLHLVESCSVAEFWSEGLGSTYADEIRSEKSTRGRSIFSENEKDFMTHSHLALQVLAKIGVFDEQGNVHSQIPFGQKQAHRRKLHWTRTLKKAVIVLRLCKAAFSFRGGLEYARWKVERHSGVRLEVSDFQRRHPMLGGLVFYLQAARRGALR